MSDRNVNLEPLVEFICDGCGGIIDIRKDSDDWKNNGWIEWLEDSSDQSARGFRICHQGCQIYGQHEQCSDYYLARYMEYAPAFIFSFIGTGHLHESTLTNNRIRDMKEFLDLARRLTVPYYEEARQYWGHAVENGDLCGANECSPYEVDFLKHIINEYGPYNE